MSVLVQDFRYACRALRKNPSFTGVAVLALALGIGANSAIFSVIDAVLLAPLPYPRFDELVMVWESDGGAEQEWVTPANFLDWQDQTRTFSGMAAFSEVNLNLIGSGEPERLQGCRTSATLFPVLGIEPLVGRFLMPDDDVFGGPRVVVLSHRLWQRSFGSDPGLVGRTINLNSEAHTVVGVMPARFAFPSADTLFWVPLAFTADEALQRRSHYLRVVGRLDAGVALGQAQADMNRVAAGLHERFASSNTDTILIPLQQQRVGSVGPLLLVLAGAVGFVLLIACANVANLLLSRASSRRREIAVRAALGAGRLRLVRQLLTESCVLALIGGGGGVLVAYWGLRILLTFDPGTIASLQDATIDWRALVFTGGLSLITGVIFGLVPALQMARPRIVETLKATGPTLGRAGSRVRQVLGIAEVALAFVLLVGAGLMIASIVRLVNVDPGFVSTGVLTMRIDLSESKYGDLDERRIFYRSILNRLERISGVEAAGVISFLPFTFQGGIVSVETDGRTTVPGDENFVLFRVVSSGYVRTLGIPLLSGRPLTDRDVATSPPVTLINQAMAKQFWPEENPVGRHVSIGMEGTVTREVVGVIADARQFELSVEPRPEVYLPYGQSDAFWAAPRNLVVRTVGDPLSFVASVKAAVWSVDPDQPVSSITTLENVVARSVVPWQFNTLLLTAFGGIALLLASLGIYGVLAHAVSQRSHEIGVRTALGATPGDIVTLVLKEGAVLAVTGIVIGIATSVALTRFLRHLLFEVSPTDPRLLVATGATLLVVALLACYVPVRRALNVDPVQALHAE